MASKLSQSNCNFQIGNEKIPFSSDFSIRKYISIMQIKGANYQSHEWDWKQNNIDIDRTPKLSFLNTISPEFMEDFLPQTLWNII